MRVVEVDGRRFVYSFKHWAEPFGSGTTAMIFDANTKEFMASGTAKCHVGDNFCKETGRKLSLARALFKLYPENGTMAGRRFKQERKAFWTHYFARKGDNVARNRLALQQQRQDQLAA